MGCLVRYSTYSTYSKEPGESGCSVGCLARYSTYSTYSKEPGESGCSVGCLVRYSTYSTYSKDPSWGRRPTVRLWARRPVLTGCGVPGKGGNGLRDLYAFGRASAWSVPSKGRPPCRELLAVVQGPQTLRHGDRLVGPELSLLAHRVLDTLRRDFHEDAALQHRARVRVEDLVKRASAPLKPFEH